MTPFSGEQTNPEWRLVSFTCVREDILNSFAKNKKFIDFNSSSSTNKSKSRISVNQVNYSSNSTASLTHLDRRPEIKSGIVKRKENPVQHQSISNKTEPSIEDLDSPKSKIQAISSSQKRLTSQSEEVTSPLFHVPFRYDDLVAVEKQKGFISNQSFPRGLSEIGSQEEVNLQSKGRIISRSGLQK